MVSSILLNFNAFLLSLRGSVINGEQNMLEVVGENIIDLQFWSVCLCMCYLSLKG